MSTLPMVQYLPNVSELVFGCMSLGGGDSTDVVGKKDLEKAHAAVNSALAIGINIFDHADIYGGGRAERVFGRVLKDRPSLRDDIFIQSKCGIRFQDASGPKRYDWSKVWILDSVDGILKRLHIDYLDVLILHRPDPLAEMDEVADAIHSLVQDGKIRYMGVSNMHGQQLAYLQKFLTVPIIVNQIELHLNALQWIEEGVLFNSSTHPCTNFSPGTMAYCQEFGVQLQSWGSLSQGVFSGKDLSETKPHIQKTASLLARMAETMGVGREAVILAWLMRHPAKIQPVIGTADAQRIANCGEFKQVKLSREQWYEIYESARGEPLP